MEIARFSALLCLLGAGVTDAADPTAADDPAASYSWTLPPGFPTPWVPADNPMSDAKVQLGARLFCEPRLSVTGTASCASCHDPSQAFTDGRARAIGATGALTRRSAITLTNVAYQAAYGWRDLSVHTLEQQMSEPLFGEHPVTLGLSGRERELMALLRDDADYRQRFDAAFPGAPNPVSVAHLVKAIAAFERTLISGRSAFDRYVFDDERTALSSGARRGMALFYSARTGCAECHGGLNFAGPWRYLGHSTVSASYANTGVGLSPGRYRVPTLRNIALTAPYMHDGSIATLAEVIERYDLGKRGRDVDPRIRPLHLTAPEKADLLAFLESLTDAGFVQQRRCDLPGAGAH